VPTADRLSGGVHRSAKTVSNPHLFRDRELLFERAGDHRSEVSEAGLFIAPATTPNCSMRRAFRR
jgi:hypothetical protein